MSEHFPTHDEFWQSYLESVHAGRPHVWQRPFERAMLMGDEVLDCLRAVSDRMATGNDEIMLRIYAGSSPQCPDPANHPQASDTTLASYIERLEARLGDDVGVMISELQGLSRSIWLRIASFMAAHRRVTNRSVGAALADLFVGRYRRGFFGLHKDEQDVFTFVIEGRKRFFLWPYEAFSYHLDNPDASILQSWKLGAIDYESLRADAIVIEGGPGDVFYWPAEYWHVAEAVPDGGIASTVSLGLIRTGSPKWLLGSLSRQLDATLPCPDLPSRADEQGRVDSALAASRELLAAWLDQTQTREWVDLALLARMSRFGFEVVPEPAPSAELEPGTILRAPWRGAVPWTCTTRGQLLWSAHGATMRLPAHPALIQILEHINTGEPFEVARLVGSLPLVGEVAGESLELEPSLINRILQRLVQMHVLELVSPESIQDSPPETRT